MRCSQCGTHNEPDSRFCGGCGARLAGSLAPTHKLAPDAQFTPGPVQPQPTTLQRQPPPPNSASQPVARPSSAPQPVQQQKPSAPQPAQRQPSAPQPVSRPSQPSVPPIGQRGPRAQSVPPASNGVPAVRPARGSLADASLSMTPARGRPWAVIIVVLVIDLALAATGGWLLSQGLADPPAQPPAPGSAARTGSTSTRGEAIGTIAPAAALPAARIVPPAKPPEPPKALLPVTASTPVAATPEPPKPKARKRPSGKKKSAGGPVDPYDEQPPPGPALPPYPPPPEPP